MDTTELCELSSNKNGAKIIFASDDTFGVAENLLKETEPVMKSAHKNKFKDAWITKKTRISKGQEFVIIRLAARAKIDFICVDTAFLINEVAYQFSIQAANMFTESFPVQICHHRIDLLKRFNYLSKNWQYLITPQNLNPGCSSMNKTFFMIDLDSQHFTHLRLNILPQGGITRLHVYGKIFKSLPMLSRNCEVDLVSKIYGGKCIAYSNCYNDKHPNNLIKPVEPKSINDGWHTATSPIRSAEHFTETSIDQILGEEWAIFQLGYSSKINSIIINTLYCTQHAPYAVRVQGIKEGINLDAKSDFNIQSWEDIVPYTITKPAYQVISVQNNHDRMAYVKLSIKPNGYLSRLRILGNI